MHWPVRSTSEFVLSPAYRRYQVHEEMSPLPSLSTSYRNRFGGTSKREAALARAFHGTSLFLIPERAQAECCAMLRRRPRFNDRHPRSRRPLHRRLYDREPERIERQRRRRCIAVNRGHVLCRASCLDLGRPATRRGHEPHRSAVGHGSVARRDPARPLGSRLALSGSSALAVRFVQRARIDAQRHRPSGHPASPATRRHGDRSQACSSRWARSHKHFSHRGCGSPRLRPRARMAPARVLAARPGEATSHVALPRYRACHLFH